MSESDDLRCTMGTAFPVAVVMPGRTGEGDNRVGVTTVGELGAILSSGSEALKQKGSRDLHI